MSAFVRNARPSRGCEDAVDSLFLKGAIMAKQLAVSVGDEVRLVLANKECVPAKVTATGKRPNCVDLHAEVNGEFFDITSSPYDPTKQQADSWHLPHT